MQRSAIETRLKAIGSLPDHDVPMVETLMLMGGLDRLDDTHDEIDFTACCETLASLNDALDESIAVHPYDDKSDINHWRLDRLNDAIFVRGGFHGDARHDGFTDPEKINFMDVLENRTGIPVALGVLYYELAHTRGWPIAGLNFPGHFIMHLEHGSSRLIFDPFHEGRVLDAASMRRLLKDTMGERAELSHNYYTAVTARDVILRFCNNRKIRFVQNGSYEKAYDIVQHELWVAPAHPLLYFDGGIIAAKLEMLTQAIDYFNRFIALSDDGHTIAEARAMVLSLQRQLQ